MERFSLTIAALTLTFVSHGQTLTAIRDRVERLISHKEFKSDTTGFFALPKFALDCSNKNETKWDDLLVVDLNNDGLKDLIVSGPCNPYDNTSIYINERTRLALIHDSAGKINFIDKNAGRTIINIRKEPCCCDAEYSDTEVTIDTTLGTSWNSITYVDKISIDDKLIEVTASGILRRSPVVNDADKKDQCSNRMIKGNHLANITKPSKVIQLTRSGQWRLVLYPIDKSSSMIGWMSE